MQPVMQALTPAAALSAGDRVEAALALRAKGLLAEALEVLATHGEFSQDVYILRGDLQLELGRLQDAVATYSTILAFEGENVYAQQNLAVCLYRLKRWEAAAGAFRKLLAHEGHRDNARIGLGDSLLHLG